MYPHASNSADSSKILTWAIKELDLMSYFFDNMREFNQQVQWSNGKEQNDEVVSEREQQIQVRFLMVETFTWLATKFYITKLNHISPNTNGPIQVTINK